MAEDGNTRHPDARSRHGRLLDAAYPLFLAKGYAATSIPAITEEAGVAVPTVYWAFRSKRALLWELVSTRTAGDDEPVPLAERPWWREMLAEPDPERQLQRFASINRELHARTADLLEIVRGAAASDTEIAEVRRQGSQQRYQDVEGLARSLGAKGALRPGVTVEQAADFLWVMTGSDWYRMLVGERGWSSDLYEAWEVAALTDFLLPPDKTPAPNEDLFGNSRII